MRCMKALMVAVAVAALSLVGDKSSWAQSASHAHGTGPNGGVVFDLGAYHAEFLVDHEAKEFKIVFLGADEKSAAPVGATELIVVTKETKTAEGKAVPTMTVMLAPAEAASGKASTFVGSNPLIANVADFSGSVIGDIDGKPASGEFDEAGAGHGHAHAPHDGMVAPLKNANDEVVGFVELKLHDDKGDLELWLAKDREIAQPLDIPANSEIGVAFLDFGDKIATLRVRNNDQNEDEDGKPNLRNGKTNYFIFPGDSGQDPSWLMGAKFKSAVKLSFTLGGQKYTSEEFVLVPHTHADGHSHNH